MGSLEVGPFVDQPTTRATGFEVVGDSIVVLLEPKRGPMPVPVHSQRFDLAAEVERQPIPQTPSGELVVDLTAESVGDGLTLPAMKIIDRPRQCISPAVMHRLVILLCLPDQVDGMSGVTGQSRRARLSKHGAEDATSLAIVAN